MSVMDVTLQSPRSLQTKEKASGNNKRQNQKSELVLFSSYMKEDGVGTTHDLNLTLTLRSKDHTGVFVKIPLNANHVYSTSLLSINQIISSDFRLVSWLQALESLHFIVFHPFV